jgi:predicted metalloprotease
MRWRDGRRSRNIEDRRGRRIARKATGGGIGIVVIALIAMYFGIDPTMILNQQSSPGVGTSTYSTSDPASAGNQQLVDFISVVLGDTEDTWHELFRQMNKTYQEPILVLFSGAVESACGYAQAAVGPFYCPRDQKVYIDLSFYRDLKSRYQAPGDFAQAYVIAHEIGHHVQTLLGISQKVHQLRGRLNEVEANRLSVMQELQADCFAGVWAHHAQRARNILEKGDIEEALTAASSIGDDRLQKQSRGYITPDSFTHGSSEQRVRWFKQGLATGEIAQCNTFNADRI